MWFLKENLVGNYFWGHEETQSNLYSGNPSRRLFNRSNGDQVLYLINLYGSLSESFTIREGRKMEALLVNNLPAEIKSEISVFNWLRSVYSSIPEEEIAFINEVRV